MSFDLPHYPNIQVENLNFDVLDLKIRVSNLKVGPFYPKIRVSNLKVDPFYPNIRASNLNAEVLDLTVTLVFWSFPSSKLPPYLPIREPPIFYAFSRIYLQKFINPRKARIKNNRLNETKTTSLKSEVRNSANNTDKFIPTIGLIINRDTEAVVSR